MLTGIPHTSGNRFGRTKRQHLVVCRVIWDEEAQVSVSKDSRNSDQASSSSWDNAHVLPSILRGFSFTMMLIIELGNSLTQRLDTSSGAILASSHGNIDSLWPLKATLDFVVYLWGSLSEIGPRRRIISKAMLIRSLCAPDHTCRSTRRVKPGVRLFR